MYLNRLRKESLEKQKEYLIISETTLRMTNTLYIHDSEL